MSHVSQAKPPIATTSIRPFQQNKIRLESVMKNKTYTCQIISMHVIDCIARTAEPVIQHMDSMK